MNVRVQATMDYVDAVIKALIRDAPDDGDLAKFSRLSRGTDGQRIQLVNEILRLQFGFNKTETPDQEAVAKITGIIAANKAFEDIAGVINEGDDDKRRSLAVIVKFVVEHAG